MPHQFSETAPYDCVVCAAPMFSAGECAVDADSSREQISVDNVLDKKATEYVVGSFADRAEAIQAIKNVIRSSIYADGSPYFADDQLEALDMIAHKIGRIIMGDPNNIDAWVDIAGYAQLVVNRLGQEKA